jgi:hypothetical protein
MKQERLALETSAMKLFVVTPSENTTDAADSFRLEYENGQQEFASVQQCIIFIVTHPEIFSSDDYDEFLEAINN